jgi:hypothetical protein
MPKTNKDALAKIMIKESATNVIDDIVSKEIHVDLTVRSLLELLHSIATDKKASNLE